MSHDIVKETQTAVDASMPIASSPRTADTSASVIHPSATQAVGKFPTHADFDVTIIWQNIDSRSNFKMFRKESRGPIERIITDFGTVLESGVIDHIISVNASKHLFCVTLATEKNKEDGVMDQILAVL